MKNKKDNSQIDYILLIITLILITFGISILFSASYYKEEYENPISVIEKPLQLLFFSVFVIMPIFININLDFLRNNLDRLLIFLFFLLVSTLIFGRELLGGARWLVVNNVSFQPSELAKVILIIYLAHTFDVSNHLIQKNDTKAILRPFFVLMFFCSLIFFENDFSTTSLIFIVSFIIFYLSGINILYFVVTIILILPTIPLILTGHRKTRINIFFHPEDEPLGDGFQILQSLEAIKEGSFFGKGIGNGTIKKFLPEIQSDFIFSVVAEEMGFIGVLLIIFLFFIFAFRSYILAYKCIENKFSFYLIIGLANMILIQFLLNISVVAKLVPPTGLNLPFFSSGGSSFLTSSIMVSLILNVSKQARQNK